jgi:Glycosyl transferase family 2
MITFLLLPSQAVADALLDTGNISYAKRRGSDAKHGTKEHDLGARERAHPPRQATLKSEYRKPNPPEQSPAMESTTLYFVSGHVDQLRKLVSSKDDYCVFSTNSDLVVDGYLIQRITDEVAHWSSRPGGHQADWFVLSADGMDIDSRRFAAAYFEHEPTLCPDRGRHPIAAAFGSLLVVNVPALRKLGLERHASGSALELINTAMVAAYRTSIPSYFSARLFPAFSGRPRFPGKSIDELLTSRRYQLAFPEAAAAAHDPGEQTNKTELYRAVIEECMAAHQVRKKASFVVRTLFKRNHMLRRLLVSIDYIRRSAAIAVEIVLATDVDGASADGFIGEMAADFVGMEFTRADGNAFPGFSRVRNLRAGIHAATGDLVCIIDDDDYFTPAAVEIFLEAASQDQACLYIMDTQIVNEKWSTNSVKVQKEIVGYGTRYKAQEWPVLFRGVNSVPLCGVVHPREFIQSALNEYGFRHDLSEDFFLHLLLLSHPRRPQIRIFDRVVYAYQSHRVADDNVSNVVDRRGWCLDTCNGLFDVLFGEDRSFEVISRLEADLTHLRDGRPVDVERLLAENDRLRAALVSACEQVALVLSTPINDPLGEP